MAEILIIGAALGIIIGIMMSIAVYLTEILKKPEPSKPLIKPELSEPVSQPEVQWAELDLLYEQGGKVVKEMRESGIRNHYALDNWHKMTSFDFATPVEGVKYLNNAIEQMRLIVKPSANELSDRILASKEASELTDNELDARIAAGIAARKAIREAHVRKVIAGVGRPKNRCSNCEGSGYLLHFSHVLNGVCFSCNGTGKKK
ncbi:hypothetical protein [Colwellia sp. Arc7-D]|uniref:hypothetical protein n=1 Tax=Colwellia sp. Arc7-D TaxID=2161872 RepID=UPI000D39D272|nr:hypothetical protein [Colwellia sp. Arc7-D]AWB57441.1 hypothetical protein DBO93_07690 [Colwellia sp. Arc7-D]